METVISTSALRGPESPKRISFSLGSRPAASLSFFLANSPTALFLPSLEPLHAEDADCPQS